MPFLLYDDYEITKNKNGKYDYTIKRINVNKLNADNSHGNLYISILKDLGLYNKLSDKKFIPKIYKDASTEQKLSLLQGLMDTDGIADKCGNISFSSSSHQLAKDVQELIWSIGGIAKIIPKKKFYTYNGERKQGKNINKI